MINNSIIGDLLLLDAYNSWPLIIKIYYFHYDNNCLIGIKPFEDIFRLMEITLFKMIYSYGDYRTNSFHSFSKEYSGNIEELRNKLVNTAKTGFQPYWQFEKNFSN
jgi:hypothetical protein